MSSGKTVSKFPPRTYKIVQELASEENSHLRFSDIEYLTNIDESVHISTEGSKISEYFEGKSVFITGGTGFLGCLLIEKLLRSCKGLKTIYMLVRPKKGKNVESRIEEVLNNEIFHQLEKVQPKFRLKIFGIAGDASLPQLGINESDRAILKEKVNVIFHGAATVRFDEKLRLATAINVCGTIEVLNLAKQCKNLCSMVHVSTAYSNCPHEVIEEKFYDPPITADELLEIVQKNKESSLEENLSKILRGWPNTYSFTKAIAEDVIRRNGDSLPICVYRPGIVISTYREPIRNWINNLYGPMSCIIGAGTGIMKAMLSDHEKVTDLVPADFVVNGMIAAAYHKKFSQNGKVEIYNYVSCAENPMTWGHFHDLAVYYGLQFPTIHSVWYYSTTLTKNSYVFFFLSFFLHFIPAFFVDIYLRVIGKKPKIVKLYKKVNDLFYMLAYFSTKEWKFHNENTTKLWDELSEIDKKVFLFSLRKDYFDWNRYASMLGPGARVYLLKDPLSTLPEAQKKYKRLYYLHKTVLGIFYLAIIALILRLSSWFFSSSV